MLAVCWYFICTIIYPYTYNVYRFKALGAAGVIRVVNDDLVIGGYKIPAKVNSLM